MVEEEAVIDSKKIAELRTKLVTLKYQELSGSRPATGFYDAFSEEIGELLAMADAFNKIRRGRANAQVVTDALAEFDRLKFEHDRVVKEKESREPLLLSV